MFLKGENGFIHLLQNLSYHIVQSKKYEGIQLEDLLYQHFHCVLM